MVLGPDTDPNERLHIEVRRTEVPVRVRLLRLKELQPFLRWRAI
ncbi:hypothetical protein [Thermodesulfitimonas autotrophica]